MFRRSFQFAFILTLTCTALFLVLLKKGAGWSTEISDIGHLTERGNEIVAEKIADILVTSDILPEAQKPNRFAESLAETDLK